MRSACFGRLHNQQRAAPANSPTARPLPARPQACSVPPAAHSTPAPTSQRQREHSDSRGVMRRKKHKHTRRALRFYRIQHGFRPPYKVLVDGYFVHALEAMK